MNPKWTSEKSLFLSRCVTTASLALGVVSLFCIPVITNWYDAVSSQEPIHNIMNVVLYLSALLAIFSLWQLRGMLNRFTEQKVFVEENVACFRIIAWCCFAVAAIWLVLCFWRLLAFFVAFAAAFVGLMLRVIKNMLEAAVALREENDYTI